MTASAAGTLEHDALFYTDAASYRSGCLDFVRAGLEQDEPVLVAVPQPGLGLLRSALSEAESARVRTADMAQAGRNPGRIIGTVLTEHGALVGASDHGSTKALYAKDPDGIEFEVSWLVPAALLDPEQTISTRPLHLEREIERYGADTRGGVGVSVPTA